jgi:oxygen-dependent protoporphyrinogen oxidase
MRSVAVVGAGISGLSAAYFLRRSCDVHVFEASDTTGGVLQTERTEGYLVEHGPNTIRGGKQPLEAIVEELELADERIYPGDTAKKRFIAKDGQPVQVPLNPLSLLTTSLFSCTAKARLLKEPFQSSAPAEKEETVREFIARRFGQEIVDYAVDPFMAGVYAGDPDELSAAHVLSRLYAWEQQHGSIIRGALFGKSADGEASAGDQRIFTFRGGLRRLPEALTDYLDNRLQLGTAVTELRPRGGKWQLTLEERAGQSRQSFDAVVLTVPLHRLDHLKLEIAADLEPLYEVPYPPLSTLALGFHRDQISHPLDGFGVLIPRKEPFQILGTLFSSSLAPDRAPENHVLLTTFIGGMRAPELTRLSTADLLQIARKDLENLLGVQGKPPFYRHIRHPHAIPQYVPGYQRVLDTLETLERDYRGLYFAGNFRDGISVGDAMASGEKAGKRLLRTL